jgi:hypothetical protein
MANRRYIFLLLAGILHLCLFAQVNEAIKHKMFCAAMANFSTAPNYVVAKVKNLESGEVKEVCAEAPFFSGAVSRQTGVFTVGLDCSKYKSRYFEFSKDSALWNIGFDLYSKAELDAYAEKIGLTQIISKIKSGAITGKTFEGSRKEQIMFAHLMFNNGIMMTRGCMAGNVCGLSCFKEK